MLLSRIFAVLLGLYLLSSIDAVAGDYTVSYAFDAGDLNDAGTTTKCKYQAFCQIELVKLDLSISLVLYRGNKIDVSVLGGRSRLACCYFSDGVHWFSRDLDQPFVRLVVYEGHARRRNEYIQNLPVGVLYLQFSGMK